MPETLADAEQEVELRRERWFQDVRVVEAFYLGHRDMLRGRATVSK